MSKFLIIRFSSIGDIVLTTPVVRCLKKQIDNAEVHFLTKKQFLPVVEANPYINKVFVADEKPESLISQLKAEKYDYIIDLHKNIRSQRIRLNLFRKYSTFSKINIRKWLIVNLKLKVLPDIHIVDRYFEAVGDIGVKNDTLGLDYFIPANSEGAIDSLPPEYRKHYLAWVIGGNHFTKIFPAKKIIEVCQKIKRPVILIGGPEDFEKGERIKNACDDFIFNACGKYSLHQSATLVRSAAIILTNDTGMMHIAAAFRKRIISFWGNTIPQFGMYPYMPGNEKNSIIVEIDGLSCRPCSKIGYSKCPKNHFDCMNKIEVGHILQLIDSNWKE